ncbi:MAG: LysM peptidoglycan-binding domain-containing protein [Candidatus Sericytochromatia bacterium]|uniref:LysM peptidoglycan-binding domain-containing protein n=1 Tax=Candidatus Tanganyikabacteria bacterium TaxID=2961651 RepID=A0A938BMU3_9BACT|nr:LysM peptidoglycan-binding domain-containing protein [Candidatus Tanganyikabacteria bacterium]
MNDDAFDISHELAILYRLAEQGEAPPRRYVVRSARTSVAAVAVALGWAGAAYAARTSYTVSPGETLYKISSQQFGGGTRWHEIAALNNISDPARVRAGQVITLPDPHERIAVSDRQRLAGSGKVVVRTLKMSKTTTTRAANLAGMRTSGGRISRNDPHAAIGRNRDGVRIVPAGAVVLELPALRVDARTASRPIARTVEAERVRPQQDAEIVAPLPAPPIQVPDSPWKAVDGAAFLVGALGMAGLLSHGRAASRRNYRAQWKLAAPALGAAAADPFWAGLKPATV